MYPQLILVGLRSTVPHGLMFGLKRLLRWKGQNAGRQTVSTAAFGAVDALIYHYVLLWHVIYHSQTMVDNLQTSIFCCSSSGLVD